MEKYDIYFANIHLASIKQKFKFKSEILINTSTDSYIATADDLFSRSFVIRGKRVSAKIEKKKFNIKDIYKVDIFDDNDKYERIFLAATIAIDNSLHN